VGYGPSGAPVLTPADLPAELGQAVTALRSTPAGAFVLRMYADERGRVLRRASQRVPAGHG
jgi:hypothetical protein